MGRSQQPACAPRPREGTESTDADDDLLDRWLARPPRTRAGSSWPPRRAAGETPVLLGDRVADEWFR
jgi:hypothetical protein